MRSKGCPVRAGRRKSGSTDAAMSITGITCETFAFNAVRSNVSSHDLPRKQASLSVSSPVVQAREV